MSDIKNVYVVSITSCNNQYVRGVHVSKASAMKEANIIIQNLKLKWYHSSDESCFAESIDPDGENELSIVKWAIQDLTHVVVEDKDEQSN
jgi:hypothetical protein